jgi:hypothetical protein
LLDSGYLPEMHLWTPWSGKHNYTGPGTKLWDRVDKKTRRPKPGNEPVNGVDRLALQHDLDYEDYKDHDKRAEADKKMIAGLDELIKKGTWKEKLDAYITKAALKGKQLIGAGIPYWLHSGFKQQEQKVPLFKTAVENHTK